MGRLLLGFARLQRFAKDIAQRRARIGRTILLHRLLLLGDLLPLDRESRLLRPVEARHPARKSVAMGTSVYVRVDMGGVRVITKYNDIIMPIVCLTLLCSLSQLTS